MSDPFVPGIFLEYRALTSFHLGSHSLDIPKGAVFLYDGDAFRYQDAEYTAPELRKILGRIFVPVDDEISSFVQQPSAVNVRPATPEAEGKVFKTAVRQEETFVRKVYPTPPPSQHMTDLSLEDQQILARANAINQSRIRAALDAPVQKPPTSGDGPLQRQYQFTVSGAKREDVRGFDVSSAQKAEAKPPRPFTKEGSSNQAVRITQDSYDDLQVPGTYVAQYPVRAAEAPATVPARPRPVQKTPEQEMQEIVDGWSTKRAWQTRVDEAANYGDWPELLDAICAIETPKVAAQIRAKVQNG